MKLSKRIAKIFIIVTLTVLYSIHCWAWGKRGHSLVCETAAYVAASDKKSKETHFLKLHSFDFGYYCNVPDLIWKRPATYKKESKNHFMNFEHFERNISKQEAHSKQSPYRLSRKEFDKKYPKIPESKGRSWWRIQEFDKELSEITEKLKSQKLTKKQRQELQTLWLAKAGTMGHYIGDLAMPLHVSENYDGEMTGQKGLHHYFEETMVDELYLQDRFALQGKVYKDALKQWPQFLKKSQKKDTLTLIRELTADSQKAAKSLLSIDKKTGRGNLKKALQAHKGLVVSRLVKGVLYQAYFFHKNLGWEYNGERFYGFKEAPDFVEPPQ